MKERFEKFVMPIPWSGCHIWMGTSLPSGYGLFRTVPNAKHSMSLAHRISYQLHNGPIPEGHLVLHKCDTPSCVNPGHLFTGTSKDNSQDMKIKGRSSFGEKHGRSKLTQEQVIMIRQDTRMQKEIAAEYGVSQSNISLIKRGINWEN